MPKCINNCHDLEGFWKSWHASYNKWLVRYNLFSVFISSFLVQHVTCIFCTFSLKVLIHSSRRYTEEAAQRLGCLHICCIVAWLRMVTRPTYGAFSFCLFNYWCLSDIKYILRKMLKLISFMIVLCILIVWTGSFFHGHGWLACSLFQKCWWSPQQLHSRYIWSCIPSFPFFYPLIFCLQLMLFHQCLISINKETRIHVVLRFRIVCILSFSLYFRLKVLLGRCSSVKFVQLQVLLRSLVSWSVPCCSDSLLHRILSLFYFFYSKTVAISREWILQYIITSTYLILRLPILLALLLGRLALIGWFLASLPGKVLACTLQLALVYCLVNRSWHVKFKLE